MTQKTKPYYRFILEVKPGAVLTTKRGGGSGKLRETDYPDFQPGDLCLVENNRAYPLSCPTSTAPQVLVVT